MRALFLPLPSQPSQFYEFGAFRSTSATLDIWGTNSSLVPVPVRLELSFIDLNSPWSAFQTLDAILLPNQTTELLSLRVPGPPPLSAHAVDPSHSVVVSARFVDAGSDVVLARAADWPQPFRLLDVPDPGLEVRVDAEAETLTVDVAKPVKCVFFTADEIGEGALGRDEGVKWSDNALDVFPGDPQVLRIQGLKGKRARIRVAHLGCEKGKVVYEQ